MKQEIKASIERSFRSQRIEIILFTGGATDRLRVKNWTTGLYDERREEEELPKDYVLMFHPDEIKAIADALADKHMESDKEAQNEGELRATKKHLEDMRTLVLYGGAK